MPEISERVKRTFPELEKKGPPPKKREFLSESRRGYINTLSRKTKFIDKLFGGGKGKEKGERRRKGKGKGRTKTVGPEIFTRFF